MTDLPDLLCGPCARGQHGCCTGWVSGWCGCGAGLCWLRLLTGVMWDFDDQPKHEGD